MAPRPSSRGGGPRRSTPISTRTGNRHLFIERVGDIDFYHYDPYAQLLSKVVRGFRKDVLDAVDFVGSGMVDPSTFRELVRDIPEAAWARYPNLSREAVVAAVEDFLSTLE